MFSTTMIEQKYITKPLYFRAQAEFESFWKMKQAAWTEWYANPKTRSRALLQRVLYNGKALCFPEFFREIRTETGVIAGYLFATPAFWDGKVKSLMPLDYYDSWHNYKNKYSMLAFGAAIIFFQSLKLNRLFRFLLTSFRKKKLRGKNTVVLTALFVSPDFRGQKIPSRLFQSIKAEVKKLGYLWLISPFRPSQYGRYKKETGLLHSRKIFNDYCYKQREDGLPVDRWLRSLIRNRMVMLKPEVNSFSLAKPLSRFREFQKRYKPGQWYQPAPGVWECGETQTWYVDEEKGTATSVEPDLWGMLPVE
ncbi:MAG: GNAT family N-acetyltransferase [Candidatus Auribacterota bacterium]|nr:GNAT family N-acetyltransferase [Candidatus Auribacterota bacterium]